VSRLLVLTPGELTRDPRARRTVLAARAHDLEVVGLSAGLDGGDPVPLDGVRIVRLAPPHVTTTLRGAGLGGMRTSNPLVRELRGVFRLGRLATTTARLARAGRLLGPVEIVHANDLDTLPAGYLVSRRHGSRLVYDAHELYSDQEPDPPRVHRFVAERLESMLARRTDAVVTVSEPIAAELTRRLRLGHEPFVVLNCPERSDDAVESAPHDGPLRAIYQGAMGPGRPLDDLLRAAETASGVHLTLRVAGADIDALRGAVRARGLDARIAVVEPVPPDRLLEGLRGFHVGLIINRPVTRNDELVFPNKLFEYMMAGLAVAVPRLPGMAPLVEEAGIGVTFEPGSPEALGAALSALAGDRDGVARMASSARRLALEQYNAEAQSSVLPRAWGL